MKKKFELVFLFYFLFSCGEAMRISSKGRVCMYVSKRERFGMVRGAYIFLDSTDNYLPEKLNAQTLFREINK